MYRDSLNKTRYDPYQVKRTTSVFNLPLKLKEPSKIFTSSLTDFLHEVCDAFRPEAWSIIQRCPQHTFQILSKRPERWELCRPEFWGKGWNNVWLGTSVGSTDGIARALHLIGIPAKLRFLSLEPLHGSIYLKPFFNLSAESRTGKPGNTIDWVIVGGESGNDNGKYRYRECKLEWIERIIIDCKNAGVPVFVKQLGTHLAKKMGLKDRHGGNWDEWPEHLRIREFPVLQNQL